MPVATSGAVPWLQQTQPISIKQVCPGKSSHSSSYARFDLWLCGVGETALGNTWPLIKIKRGREGGIST